MNILIVSYLLTVLLVVIAGIVALFRDVVASIVVFAAYSLVMAILWVALQAPDVALTEAAVGAGVTTSLFLIAIIKTARPVGEHYFRRNIDRSSLVVGAVIAGIIGLTLPALPPVGEPNVPAFARVAPYYLTHSVSQFGIENVVTAILAGYRSFDTFGEVTVVFAAALAVFAVFGREVI